MKQYKKLIAFFSRRDKALYAGLMGLMVLGSLMDVLGVGAVPAFVATLAIPEKVMAYPMVARVLDTLGITTGRELVLWGCLGLIVIYVLKNVFLAIIYYAQVRFVEQFRIRFSHHMFSVYMNAPYEFHLERNSSELLRNVNLETREVVQGVLTPLVNVVMGSLMTLSIVVFMAIVTPSAALFGVGIVGGGSWLFMRLVKDRLHNLGKDAQDQRRTAIQVIMQGLGGLVPARIQGREHYFIKAFYRSMKRFTVAVRWRQYIMKVSTPVLETIAITGLLLIVLVMILSGADVTTLIPTLALFGAAIVRLRATISQIVSGITQIRYSIAAVDPIYDDLQLLQGKVRLRKSLRPKAKTAEVTPLRLKEAMVFENINYTYPEAETRALCDINLTIKKGQSIAFVGSTGSGKTTLINVLLGLLEPQQGRLTVDGVDIRENIAGWQANVGYIPQAIFLLDDTIRRNIAFGYPDDEIDDEKIQRAIRAAQLESFVQSLDDGADTMVGEQGVRLSGGQRQRIGMARALYHNPEVLIMDEATSSLDNRTESLVMKALDNLKDERTFIIIAHRLSTVRNCDQLYFMKEGRIDASGTYDELHGLHHDFRQMAETV